MHAWMSRAMVTVRSPARFLGVRLRTITGMRARFLALTFAALVLAGCGSDPEPAASASVEATSEAPERTAFEKVLEFCDVEEDALGDDGQTLTLDGAGDDDRSLRDGEFVYDEGKLESSDLGCALGNIGTSDAVIARMEQTRAMDGMQEFSEDGFSYAWTYHPDNGLDIIVTEDEA